MEISDRKKAFALIKKNSRNWETFSYELRSDIEFIKKCIVCQSKIIKYLPTELTYDFDFLFELIKLNSNVVIYADSVIKSNRSLMLKCIKRYHETFRYVNSSLKDKQFILEALALNPRVLPLVNRSYYNDKDIMVQPYVTLPSLLLYYIPSTEIINEIALRNGLILKYIETDNVNILINAIRQNHTACIHLTDIQKHDAKLNLLLIHANSLVYPYIIDKFKRDTRFTYYAIKCNPDVIHVFPSNLKYHFHIMSAAYLYKQSVFDTPDYSVEEKNKYFETVKKLILEKRSLILFLCGCAYKKYSIQQRDKRQKTSNNIDKLNGHGQYFAIIFKNKILEYIGIKKIVEKLEIIAKLAKLFIN